MTAEQWQQLAPYAEADAQARAAFAAAQMMNTPVDARERIDADVRFQRIRMEMQRASQALEDARKRILGE